jgi:alpha-D-ribose 1-methylphosphonate 5-triphosphate diphosphatase PhnM
MREAQCDFFPTKAAAKNKTRQSGVAIFMGA